MTQDREIDHRIGQLVADAVADAPPAPPLPTSFADVDSRKGPRRRWGLFGVIAAAGAAAAIIAFVVFPGTGDETIRPLDPPDEPADVGWEPPVPLLVRDAGVPTFVERLALIPYDAAGLTAGFSDAIVLSDIDVATELAGVDRPDPDDDAGILEWFNEIAGATSSPVIETWTFGPGWSSISQTSDALAHPLPEIGMSITEVAWAVDSQSYQSFFVVGGRIDPERVRAAADGEEDGIWRFGHTGWLQPNLQDRSAFRPLGRPLAVATADDVAFIVGKNDDLVREIRDGAGETTADFEPFRTTAEILDRYGAYNARLIRIREEVSVLGSIPGALGTGLVATETGDHEVLLVIVGDESTADAYVDLVVDRIAHGVYSATDEPWSTMFDVRSTTVDGHAAIIRLGRAPDVRVPSGMAHDLIYRPDD